MKAKFSQSLHASATSMQPVYQKAQKSEYAERWLLGRRYYRELFRPANEQYENRSKLLRYHYMRAAAKRQSSEALHNFTPNEDTFSA